MAPSRPDVGMQQQSQRDRVVAEEASALGCKDLVRAGRRREAESELPACR